jgi:O-methyltransferase involved in polyketide biosynthesis
MVMARWTDMSGHDGGHDAELAERLGPGSKINFNVPSIARVYDAILGGKDNFAVDRAVADQILDAVPGAQASAQAHRAFLGRAVRFIVGSGIRQIVDLGAGLPTVQNTHTVAQDVEPSTTVVYVDNDPVVLAHARALLAQNDRVGVLDADFHDPGLLDHPDLRALVDTDQPYALIMAGVVHHIADDQVARTLVERYRQRLSAGSYLVLTHFVTGTEEARKMEEIFLGGDLKSGKFRTREQIEAYLTGLELLEPGVVFDPLWRPDEPVPSNMDDVFKVGVAAVAKVPD